MSIFPRRVIQRLIDENSEFLTQSQLEKHIDNLNQYDPQKYLDYEWEVVVLNAFSKVGKVIHEPDLESGKKPDLLFKLNDRDDVNVLADIITVSDKNLYNKNPVEEFSNKLGYILSAKHNFEDGSFEYRIEGNYGDDYLKEKKKLRLPKKSDLYNYIFNTTEFVTWIEQIKLEPSSKHFCHIINQKAEVKFTYSPREWMGVSGSYPSFNQPGHSDINYQNRNWRDKLMTQNVVYNALKSKAKYLKQAAPFHDGQKAIILCEGDCYLLRENNAKQPRLNDVVFRFLEDNTSVNFVLVLTVAQWQPNFVNMTIFRNQVSGDEIVEKLKPYLDSMLDCFPKPKYGAGNAVRWLKNSSRHEGRSKAGGSTRGYSFLYGSSVCISIKLSSRALLELMAGQVTQEEFFRIHSFIKSDHPFLSHQPAENPFRNNLEQNLTVNSIAIEKSTEEDDDLIAIRFGNDESVSSQLISMAEDEVKILRSDLMSLLSGKINQNNFSEKIASYNKTAFDKNPLKINLDKGRLIESISLQKERNTDNYWIIVNFGKVDPAISKFILPEINSILD